jgi:hypothetical protein
MERIDIQKYTDNSSNPTNETQIQQPFSKNVFLISSGSSMLDVGTEFCKKFLFFGR